MLIDLKPIPEQDLGNSGSSKTVDFSTYTAQKLTLSANCTITLSGGASGGTYLLKLVQDGTGGRTASWSTVKWPSGTAPTISSAASAVDLISLYYDGSNWYGAAAQAMA